MVLHVLNHKSAGGFVKPIRSKYTNAYLVITTVASTPVDSAYVPGNASKPFQSKTRSGLLRGPVALL